MRREVLLAIAARSHLGRRVVPESQRCAVLWNVSPPQLFEFLRVSLNAPQRAACQRANCARLSFWNTLLRPHIVVLTYINKYMRFSFSAALLC